MRQDKVNTMTVPVETGYYYSLDVELITDCIHEKYAIMVRKNILPSWMPRFIRRALVKIYEANWNLVISDSHQDIGDAYIATQIVDGTFYIALVKAYETEREAKIGAYSWGVQEYCEQTSLNNWKGWKVQH